MKKQILALGFVVFSLMLPLKAAAQKPEIEKIYTFGDSVSDVGNVYNALLKATGTGFPPPPYFQGRFSNGVVWVEYLAQKLKLNPTPYTSLPPGISSAPDGINYAFGGAGSGFNNVVYPQAPPSGLLTQVGVFTTSLTQAKRSADPNGLYIIWAGSNDYMFGQVTNPQLPVNNISTAVTVLASVGAKNIMVVNLPDLGKLPATRVNSQLSSQLTTLTNSHNSNLTNSLRVLRQNLGSSVKITLVDANTLFNTVTKYPRAFGFTNTTDACLTSVSVCPNPDQYVFWDGFHPTTAAHKQVQKLAYLTLRLKSQQAQLMLSPKPTTQLSPPRLAQLIFSESGVRVNQQ